MSSESATTGEPSRSADGEGCQGRAGQSRKDVGPKSLRSDQRAGGVSGGGGSGRVVRLSGETCYGELPLSNSTSGASAATPREAGRAVAGVGDLHSSVDPADRTTAGERREGTCPHASQSSEGPDDGWSDELWIKTSPKVRKLQRVLYRKAKAEPTPLKPIRKNGDSESRMRENRLSGLTRGGEFPEELTTTVGSILIGNSLPTLLKNSAVWKSSQTCTIRNDIPVILTRHFRFPA